MAFPFRTLVILACLPGPGLLRGQDRGPLLRGQVLSAGDSAPVQGAVVSALPSGARAVSDDEGVFAIRRPGGDSVRLTILRLGFLPDTVAVNGHGERVVVYLVRVPVVLEAVEVVGAQSSARIRFEELAQLSTVTLGGDEIRRAPALLEPDVFRTIQLLPGTVARNDFSIGYNVRGGESDQNLVLLDGVPVFNPSHLGGLFTTFDADAIGEADFLSGGFPAGYSGRLSSVLDIHLRPGSDRQLRASSALSLLSSKLLVEGPLPGPATFLVSGRRTYLDAVVQAFTKEILPYYFTDLLGKVSVRTGRGGAVALTGYWGRDNFALNLVKESDTRDPVDVSLRWGNRVLGATWTQPFGGARLETRMGHSDFGTTIGLLPNLARYDNTASLLTAGTALEFRPSPAHGVRLGGTVERYHLRYKLGSPALDAVLLDVRYRPVVWAAFLDEQWSPAPQVIIRPGARVEHVPVSRFTGFSPRVAAKFFLTPNAAITASAGRYFQAIHSIRDQEFPITLFEFWIGTDGNVPVGRADHLVLGTELWTGRDEQITLEGYRKWFTDLVTPNRGQSLDRPGDEFIRARGNAWGIDLLARRHRGTLHGWVAYTYTRATRTAAGETYPPAHDRRHTLNVVLEAPGPIGGRMAVRWGFGSPLPYTGFIGEWDHRRYSAADQVFEDAEREPLAGPHNGERYPPYSRLDVGLRWSFRALGAGWEPYLQLVNLYNRKNVFLYFFDFSEPPPTRTGVSQLPFLPTFGLEIRF